MQEYAKIAQVYDNIMEFPQQFDTIVGERGVTLSGGQKQRIALARALIKEPQILILDDSFSAVDTETEEAILQNLRRVFPGKTVIIVSHRISTLKNANHILVLEEGIGKAPMISLRQNQDCTKSFAETAPRRTDRKCWLTRQGR